MTDSSELMPPSGFYESTLDWIKQSQNEKLLYSIYPEIPIPNVKKKEELQLLVNKPRFSNKAFAAIVPNGRVLGERAVISPDHKLLWDVSVEWAKMPPEHSVFQENKLPPLIRTDKTVALLTHPASKNYYHWLLEAIARFHLLQMTRIEIDKYIVNHLWLPFQLQTLAACGIPAEKIIQPYDLFHLQARELIVPSYVNLPNSWSCNYVRNLLLPHMAMQNEPGYERIYIRRNSYRRVMNEQEIFSLLEKYGFKSIELELLPLDRQIRLFYSAKIIVAPHGAGLANLVFCNPGTSIIELFTPSFMEPHYWLLSRLMHLDYNMIIGNRENPHHYWSGFDDMSIDPKQLEEVLSWLLS
ncbi:glycosyltransferase family 61 protein [Paenibacillus elgii]|uniref:glycosyltransferase family 61 protein n=1 Tax=Paenibacillus elgii TaxID=189691 RepID=UPI00203A56B1|nr:glycosyltransferase family 61 protein [Paenibacillus elgii]MCM3269664.1 glycosyltransferase family 61 protein [Paenibacillus elgii]